MSLARIQEISPKNLILLVGPPGSGKSTFCGQATLQNLILDRPIIYVTTECGAFEVERNLKEMGLGKIEKGLLNFVDAYNDTVGLSIWDRSDTISANSSNLTSIGIAIAKHQKKIGNKGIFLVFDSLVSPYLLNGSMVLRFLRLTLSRFVAEGNSILACMDEGCSKKEDLGAMKSLSNGVLEMQVDNGKRVLNIVKYPGVKSTRIELPTDKTLANKYYDSKFWAHEMIESGSRFMQGKLWEGTIRTQIEDYVNFFWPNLIFWGAMLWDPITFPKKTYELNKEGAANSIKEMILQFPWYQRFLLNLSIPKNFSKVKDMKKVLLRIAQSREKKAGPVFSAGDGIFEFLEDVSSADEHYFRVREYYECWGFQNMGVPMASFLPPNIAGLCKGLEKEERDWNAIETKCIGLGDPYCEFKLVPGEIDELESSLEKDISTLEKINERLIQNLIGFLLDGKSLVNRPRLGSNLHLQGAASIMGMPAMAGQRYQMAWRMGGAKIGKRIGEILMDRGLGDDEAVKRILQFLKHCKVGIVSMDKTIKIKECCESIWTRYYTTTWEQPSCFFTTGFLNGFFYATRNQHLVETKCLALGNPYCEWKFR